MPSSQNSYIWISLSLSLFNYKVIILEVEEEGNNDRIKVTFLNFKSLI